MRLLSITDLHGNRNSLGRIARGAGEVDAILLGGDITNFGNPDEAEDLVRCAAEHCPVVLAVVGNCDSADIDSRLVELGVSLSGRGVMHGDVGFHGVSAMPPWLDNMYELSEDEIAAVLKAGYEEIRSHGARRCVTLSHAPPRDSALDRVHSGDHVGSSALAAFIRREQPDLVICGHIHEARGIDHVGQTTVVNCGLARKGHYAIIDLHRTVEVELTAV